MDVKRGEEDQNGTHDGPGPMSSFYSDIRGMKVLHTKTLPL